MNTTFVHKQALEGGATPSWSFTVASEGISLLMWLFMDAHKCKAEKSWPVFTSVSLHFWSHCEGSGWCKGIRVVQHHP